MIFMSDTVLISTFYSFYPIVTVATKYSPSKIVLIIDESASKNIMDDVKKVEKTFAKSISLKPIKVDSSNLLEVAKCINELLVEEKSEKQTDKKIIVNVSGGDRLLMQGALYGCYTRPDLIHKIICTSSLRGKETVLQLPILSFNLGSVKRKILEEITNRNNASIAEIARKLKKTRGMLYQHLKDLKAAGYVTEDFHITYAGKIALI